MKKMLVGVTAGLVALVVLSVAVRAAELIPVSTDAAARWGATHVLVFSESDLNTATSTATFSATITNNAGGTGLTIPAGVAVEPRALVIDNPFGGVTNAYNTTLVWIGDASSTNQYINAAQLAENGTNTAVVLVPAFTAQNATLTNNAVQVTTNILSSIKSYTSASVFKLTFLGQTNYALSAYTRGSASFYVRIFRP